MDQNGKEGKIIPLSANGDRRKAERDSMKRLVEVRWQETGYEKQASALLYDFSLRGLYLILSRKLQESLPPGTPVSCTLLVPDDIPSIGGMAWLCEGHVARINEEEDAGSIGVGIEINCIHFLETPQAAPERESPEKPD